MLKHWHLPSECQDLSASSTGKAARSPCDTNSFVDYDYVTLTPAFDVLARLPAKNCRDLFIRLKHLLLTNYNPNNRAWSQYLPSRPDHAKMADRELKQLRLGTRDADRTPFSPLDPITFIEEGIQIVQNPGASSEYFVISDSKASSSISRYFHQHRHRDHLIDCV